MKEAALDNKKIVKLMLISVCIFLYLSPVVSDYKKDLYTGYKFSAHEYMQETKPGSLSPQFSSSFIDDGVTANKVHVSSIGEFSDGTLAAAWYGGSREGAKDVSIYLSTGNIKDTGEYAWNIPRKIVTRESASKELKRYIRKLGNPVVFTDSQDGLWLIYVTVSIGGWSGSSLNVKYSSDMGLNWTESRRLTLSPLLNISTLVKNRPVSLSETDGKGQTNLYAIPVYHECIGSFSETLWFKTLNKDGDFIYSKSRITCGGSYIQPSIVPVSSEKAIAFFRDYSTGHEVVMSESSDSGKHWKPPFKTGLPNPNSALSAIRLSGNRILMAFNDSKNNRENLSLAVSSAERPDWKHLYTLEHEKDGEFSYPYMINGNSGMIHMVYTFNRDRIKHIAFNESWLKEKGKSE
jgi:predicted neuraminidase